MSDDPVRLFALALVGGGQGHILLDTRSLTNSVYVRFLQKKYGSQLPALPPEAKQDPGGGIAAMALLFIETGPPRHSYQRGVL